MSQDATPGSGSKREPTDEDVARYVAETCRDLRTVTNKPAFRVISYLLHQVQDEAERMARTAKAGGPR